MPSLIAELRNEFQYSSSLGDAEALITGLPRFVTCVAVAGFAFLGNGKAMTSSGRARSVRLSAALGHFLGFNAKALSQGECDMRIGIKHPAFKSKHLSVEQASFFSGPKLLLDGVAVTKQKGGYPVVSDSGQQVIIQMRYNLLDPIPAVKVGDAAIELAKPLRWFEYAWIGLPMLLVFAGGALGGFVGGGSTVVNGRIFRSDRSTAAKYALAAVTSIAGAAVFFVIAVAIQMAIGTKR